MLALQSWPPRCASGPDHLWRVVSAPLKPRAHGDRQGALASRGAQPPRPPSQAWGFRLTQRREQNRLRPRVAATLGVGLWREQLVAREEGATSQPETNRQLIPELSSHLPGLLTTGLAHTPRAIRYASSSFPAAGLAHPLSGTCTAADARAACRHAKTQILARALLEAQIAATLTQERQLYQRVASHTQSALGKRLAAWGTGTSPFFVPLGCEGFGQDLPLRGLFPACKE